MVEVSRKGIMNFMSGSWVWSGKLVDICASSSTHAKGPGTIDETMKRLLPAFSQPNFPKSELCSLHFCDCGHVNSITKNKENLTNRPLQRYQSHNMSCRAAGKAPFQVRNASSSRRTSHAWTVLAAVREPTFEEDDDGSCGSFC